MICSTVLKQSYCNINTEALLKKGKCFVNSMYMRHRVTIPKQPIKFPTEPAKEIQIDENTIKNLERLSLVNFEDEEMLKNFKKNIQFVALIANFDTTNVEPLYTVLEDQPLQMRPDQVQVENTRDDILRLAKCTEEDYFIAPPGNIPVE